MTREEQLSWEARWGRPAAAAACLAVVFQVVSAVLQIPAIKDAPGRNDPDRFQRTLTSFKDHAGVILASSVAQAVGTLFAVSALYYLFRATRSRRPELPGILRWLLVIIPVLMLAAAVANWASIKPAADDFTRPGAVQRVHATVKSADRKDGRKQCRDDKVPRRSFDRCVATRAAQRATAKKLLDDHRSVPAAAALFGGTIALAFAYVMIALQAMRAGLLSRFMGILGIIVGALIILPLLPQGVPVVQMFWLGALAVLYLGIWPGGRGPAWETGEPIPWPAQADLRRDGEEESEPEPEPEPQPQGAAHPVSKKRKRKRRR